MSSEVLTQIIVLFTVIGIGFIIKKVGVIDEHGSKKIASLVIYVTAPCLVVSAMINNVDLPNSEIFKLVLVSLVVYCFLGLATVIVPKLLNVRENELGIYKFMILFSNVGFVGFPVADALLGREAIFYASIYNIPFNLLVYTLGIYFVSMDNEKEAKFDWRKLLSPAVVSVFVGLFLFFTKLRLPEVIFRTVNMVGGITTPLSMLIIGCSLADAKIRNVIKNYRLILLTVFKLIIVPVLIFFVLKSLGFTGLMLGIPVIISGMPIASSAVIVSKEYGGKDIIASEGIFISTLLLLATLPMLAILLAFK